MWLLVVHFLFVCLFLYVLLLWMKFFHYIFKIIITVYRKILEIYVCFNVGHCFEISLPSLPNDSLESSFKYFKRCIFVSLLPGQEEWCLTVLNRALSKMHPLWVSPSSPSHSFLAIPFPLAPFQALQSLWANLCQTGPVSFSAHQDLGSPYSLTLLF